MKLLLLLVLDSSQVLVGQAVLRRLHTYDVVRYEVDVVPEARGARIDCRLRLRVTRPGPLRLLLSREIEGLSVERDGKPVQATLQGAGLAKAVRILTRRADPFPGLLTLPSADAAGDEVTFRIRYLWKPSGKGMALAERGCIQTHLSSFWLPSMAHEFFEAVVRVATDKVVVATEGTRQIVCLVVGDFDRHARGDFELLVPKGVEVDAEKVLTDVETVAKRLTDRFGKALPKPFRVIVEKRPGVHPAYCAGPFVVVYDYQLRWRPEQWLPLLAHEMSHAWWGHKLASPVIGSGGTWIREGLAQWSGIKVAGEILGPKVERALFRREFSGYFNRAGRPIDLRRSERAAGVVFANEPTLIDASYLDDPAIPYRRGALVHRLLEHKLGPDAFGAALRKFLNHSPSSFATADDFAKATGCESEIAYYAATSRLPDFEVTEVTAGSVAIRCLDPDWPGGRVPCLVDGRILFADMKGSTGTVSWPVRETVLPQRVELDPERIFLDPVRSNNIWTRSR